MSSRLYFARHGESSANRSRAFANREGAFPLTALGISQAREVAVRLRSAGVTVIRSSPLLRAVQTAEIVAEALDLPFTVADGLREFDVGRWEGTNLAEGWAEYEAVSHAWLAGDDSARVGGGESRTDVCARMALLIQELGRR
ncbi:MAG: histidine phosphatase family protein [bacterium]